MYMIHSMVNFGAKIDKKSPPGMRLTCIRWLKFKFDFCDLGPLRCSDTAGNLKLDAAVHDITMIHMDTMLILHECSSFMAAHISDL